MHFSLKYAVLPEGNEESLTGDLTWLAAEGWEEGEGDSGVGGGGPRGE